MGPKRWPTLGFIMGGQCWRPPPSRLIGLVRKDASVCLEAVAAVAEEAAVAAMQAFSAEQPLPQQPMPVFPGYNSRGRSLEEQQEHARLHLNGPRSLEEMRAGMKRVNDQYSREKRQAAAALCWTKRRAPK
jgi:hypothetical protein